MRRLRHVFAWLFILSVIFGVVHELSHSHHHGEPCEVCILAHAPALIHDISTVVLIGHCFEPFASSCVTPPSLICILTRSRSPPLA